MGQNYSERALNLLPYVTQYEMGPMELLNWGSSERVESNSVLELASSVAAGNCRRSGVSGIRCLAASTSLFL